jgi:anaerobic selenocysteine-containing dehydrogenase
VTVETPFRLATSPSRSFLNSTFTETPGSRRRQPGPTVLVHPADAAALKRLDEIFPGHKTAPEDYAW